MPNSADDLAKTLIAYWEKGIKDNEFRGCFYSYAEYQKSCCFFTSTVEPMDIKLGVRIIEILAFIRDSCNE